MRIIVILVLLWMPAGGLAGAESASPAAEPAMLGIAAGYPDDEGIQKDPAVILCEDYELPSMDGGLKGDRLLYWKNGREESNKVACPPLLYTLSTSRHERGAKGLNLCESSCSSCCY